MNKYLILLTVVNVASGIIAFLLLLLSLYYISNATEMEAIMGLAILGALTLAELGKSFFVIRRSFHISLFLSNLIVIFGIFTFLCLLNQSNITSDSFLLIAFLVYTAFESIVIWYLTGVAKAQDAPAGE